MMVVMFGIENVGAGIFTEGQHGLGRCSTLKGDVFGFETTAGGQTACGAVGDGGIVGLTAGAQGDGIL